MAIDYDFDNFGTYWQGQQKLKQNYLIIVLKYYCYKNNIKT